MKKQFTTTILLLIFASFSWNCEREKAPSETQFEQAVFYEIFPSLLDSIYSDMRLIPPPPEDFKNNGNVVSENLTKNHQNWEKSGEYKQFIKDWSVKRDSIDRDSTTIFLIVEDSVLYRKSEIHQLNQHFKEKNIKSVSLDLSKNFQIDILKLKTSNKKIRFKYRSKFPKGKEFWRKKYDFYIVASIEFTRIQFDQSKQFGVLNAGYTRGIMNGYGARIFIKKTEIGTWIIDTIEETWIS